MYIDIERTYKDRIEAIWDRQIASHPDTLNKDIVRLRYAVERQLKKGDVIFIGMNPSYTPGERNNNGGGFYDIEPKNNFFRAITAFCESINGIDFISHHDILYVRHTNQKDVEILMQDNDFAQFFKEQLDLSCEIIREATPKLIVVLNAGVREIFQKQMFPSDYDSNYDDKLGAHIIDIGNKVPVIFSGMLSGQRAIDLGTKQTLRWNIQRIINQ